MVSGWFPGLKPDQRPTDEPFLKWVFDPQWLAQRKPPLLTEAALVHETAAAGHCRLPKRQRTAVLPDAGATFGDGATGGAGVDIRVRAFSFAACPVLKRKQGQFRPKFGDSIV